MNGEVNTILNEVNVSPQQPVLAKQILKTTAPVIQNHSQPACKKKTMSLYNVGRI